MEELISQKAVIQDAESYNALKLTPKGREILFGREPFFIIKKDDKLPKVPTGEEDLFAKSGNYDTDLC